MAEWNRSFLFSWTGQRYGGIYTHNHQREGITFSEWLRRQIDAYLAEKEPKARRFKRKEA